MLLGITGVRLDNVMRQLILQRYIDLEARRRPYLVLCRIEQRRSPFRLELRFRRARGMGKRGMA